ncbi:1-acyl-sn-glycerol-3-phosphate acyltransferase [Patescibacteria group bacterium]|nr:1-acyl-sn-glycerol-3-phosphate acyltransferase [Patescibacteria group bacterium]
MAIDSFWHILRTRSGYQSPRKPRFLVENLPGWAALVYYAQLLTVVWLESRIARKGLYDRKAWANGSLRVFRVVESAGGRFEISGLRSMIDYGGPVVFIANHMSLIDPLVLPCILLLFNTVTFVIKEGLLAYPVFESIMKAVDPIAVTRRSPREDLKVVLTQGQDFIARGHSVFIFPQATRSETFDAANFNSLGVKLARKAGVPVVPVALKMDFQKNGKFIKEMGPVDPKKTLYLKFGEPLMVDGSGQATHQKVIEFIAENLTAWGGIVRSGGL